MNRKATTAVIAAGLAAFAGLALAWAILPWFAPDPMVVLEGRFPARAVLDCRGVPILYERGADYTWRFPVSLTNVSPAAVKVLLAVEDGRFYRHHGVDALAVARAAWQNLCGLRVVSGASTLSMQVAGWTMPGHRTLAGKLWQAAGARKLERLHSKREILEAYLNYVPFGGKLYGIEAAAEYYFGTRASALTLSEAALLCGIPQKPNRYRSDRYPKAAARRHRRVLARLVAEKVLTASEAAAAEASFPGYRNFKEPAAFARHSAVRDWRYPVERARAVGTARVSLDGELTEEIRELLRRRRDQLGGVRDAAAVLIENRTGFVRAYVGTLDFEAAEGGQVDACRAWRSAGSALKPFLYAEAIHGGMLVADTWLEDAPLRFGTYEPGNYDRTFSGKVTAAEALSRSLNTPAVWLVAQLGTNRVEALFRKIRILPPGPARENGLTLALGCAGHRLLDIARAYTVFANDGVLRELSFGEKPAPVGGERIFAPGVAAMIARMLRMRPLPGTGAAAAWKTGTSNNLRDAWCFAFTPEWTLGVWFGNKSGARAEALVGATAAAPAAGEIIERLYAGAAVEWNEPPGEGAELCAASGLAATASCLQRVRRPVVAGIPLRACTRCAKGGRDDPPSHRGALILSPAPKRYRLAADTGTVTLSLSAGDAETDWYVDGVYRGRWSGARSEPFGVGEHVIEAASGGRSESVTFTVERE